MVVVLTGVCRVLAVGDDRVVVINVCQKVYKLVIIPGWVFGFSEYNGTHRVSRILMNQHREQIPIISRTYTFVYTLHTHAITFTLSVCCTPPAIYN